MYRTMIGKLLYLTITRPSISYLVQNLSQFLDKPTAVHWKAIHRILRYIKGTQGQGLFYSSQSSLQLSAFCDSDWASYSETRKSVAWFCIFLGSSLISCRLKKQHIVSRSSAEAEYGAMAMATYGLQWIFY